MSSEETLENQYIEEDNNKILKGLEEEEEEEIVDKPLSGISTTPRLPPRPKSLSPRIKVAKLSKSEVDQYVNSIIFGLPISQVEPRYLPYIISGLKEYSRAKIAHNKILEAEQAERYAQQGQERYNKVTRNLAQQELEESVQSKLDNATDSLTHLELYYNDKLQQLEKEFEEQRRKLIEKHSDELKSLEDEWNSPEQMRHFNRTSSDLRALRKQSILLLNSRRFDEMRVVDKQAARLEKYEIQSSIENLEREYKEAKNLLLKRQDHEIYIMRRTQKYRKQTIIAQKEAEARPIQQRIENLTRELGDSKDREKVWIRLHRNERITGIPRSPPRKAVCRLKNTLTLPPLTKSKYYVRPPNSARK